MGADRETGPDRTRRVTDGNRPALLDLCPTCRIQAPHRPGREHCPRCGGTLRIVDGSTGTSTGTSAGGTAASGGTTGIRQPAEAGLLTPRPTPQAPSATPPATPWAGGRGGSTGPRSGRLFRSPHVRWVARRPPETIPPRRVRRPVAHRVIPRYVYIPQWGLHDALSVPDGQRRKRSIDPRDEMPAVFRITAYVLAVAALCHGLRYVVAVVNRGRPVPDWLQLVTLAGVWISGLAALLAFLCASAVFVRWVLDLRAASYRTRGRLEPRRRPMVACLAGLPLVNLVGAPWMVREALAVRGDDDALHRARARKIWWAWVIVNGLALMAVVTRIVASSSGSVQTAADGLWMVTLSAAVSAAFAWWLPGRLTRLIGEPEDEPTPTRRWVQHA